MLHRQRTQWHFHVSWVTMCTEGRVTRYSFLLEVCVCSQKALWRSMLWEPRCDLDAWWKMTSHCTTHTCAHTPLSAEGQCLYLYSRDLQVLLDLVYMYVCPCWPRYVHPCTFFSSFSFPLSLLLSSYYFCKSVDLCLTSRSYFVLSLMPFMDPF